MATLSPPIAVIVPAFNDSLELLELLDALQHEVGSGPRFEVVVVDDGSTDGTSELIEAHRPRFTFPIRALRQTNQGPGAARNLGARSTLAQILAFIDADARPEPGWLAALTKALADPNIGAVGGPERVRSDASRFERAAAYVMNSFLTTGGMRGGARSVARYFPRSFNMAARREVFEQVGGFPSLYDAEDLVFSAAVKRAGYRLQFVSDAAVSHRRERSLSELFGRVQRMARGRVRAAASHPELRDVMVLAPFAVIGGGLILVLLAPALPATYFGVLIADGLRCGLGVGAAAWVPACLVAQQVGYAAGVLQAIQAPPR